MDPPLPAVDTGWTPDAAVEPDVGTDPDASTDAGTCPLEKVCGSECCVDGQQCVDGQCKCLPNCDGRACGADGCGGQCSPGCETWETCSEDGQCTCEREPKEEFCGKFPGYCGVKVARDNCNITRTEDCNICDLETERCNAEHTCVLTCIDDRAPNVVCEDLQVECATDYDYEDGCRLPATISCNLCAAGSECLFGATACTSCNSTVPEDWCSTHQIQCGNTDVPGRCGETLVTDCGGCVNTHQCVDNVCELKHPNDRCPDAELLTFMGDTATVSGDTTDAASDVRPYDCFAGTTGNGGNDLVYKFILTEESDVTASLEFDTTISVAAIVSFASECPDNLGSVVPMVGMLGCKQSSKPANQTGRPAVLTMYRLQPNITYYVWVDTQNTNNTSNPHENYGPFTLTLTKTPAAATTSPEHDTCGGAISVPYSEETKIFTGTTKYGTDDTFNIDPPYSATTRQCTAYEPITGTRYPMHGPDVFYAVEVPEGYVISARLKRGDDPATRLERLGLYIRSDCMNQAEEPELACAAGSLTVNTISTVTAPLPAAIYYVVVDGVAGSAGEFELTLDVNQPAANSICEAAISLTDRLDLDGVAEEQSTTANGANNAVGSCKGGNPPTSGNELYYQFDITGPTTILARATRAAGNTMFTPYMYLRRSCDEPVEEVACSTLVHNDIASFTASLSVSGTYYLIVDSTTNTPGAFTLEVFKYDQLINDSCANPWDLTFGQDGSYHGVGSMGLSTKEVSGAQMEPGVANPYGKGVVYRFTPAVDSFLTGTMTSPGSGTQRVFYLRSLACITSTNDVKYMPTGGGRDFSFSSYGLLSGGQTYYLWLGLPSGGTSDIGVFDLDLQLMELPDIPNDTCPAAGERGEEITASNLTASWSGNSCMAHDDFSCFCNASSSARNASDLVYTFTLDKTYNVKLTLAKDPKVRPTLYVRNDCANSAASAEENYVYTNIASAQPLELSLTLGAGTYYAIVDAWVDTSSPEEQCGEFTLDLVATPMPGGESCVPGPLGPIELFPVVGTLFEIAGDTTNAQGNDGSTFAPCAYHNNSATQLDLMYTFTLAERSKLTMKVTPTVGSNLYPVILFRYACSMAATQSPETRYIQGCSRATSATATSLSYPSVKAGTYFLTVDSGTANRNGPFVLSILVEEPDEDPPTNDTCDTATPIQLTDSGGKLTGSVSAASTQYATDDYAGPQNSSCSQPSTSSTGYIHSGPDIVYSITLENPANLDITVTREPSTSTWQTVAYLLDEDCEPLNGYAITAICKNPNPPFNFTSRAASNALPIMQPGTYKLVIDGLSGDWGKVNIAVTAWPVASNATCASNRAEELIFDALGVVATAHGNTSGGAFDADGGTSGCTGTTRATNGASLAYWFDLGSPSTLTVTMARSGTSLIDPYVHLHTACETGTTNLVYGACGQNTTKGAAATFTTALLMPGRYYLFADTRYSDATKNDDTMGEFDLTVVRTPANYPPNDVCDALGAAGATVSVPGWPTTAATNLAGQSTANALNDYENLCAAATGATGGDLVYQVTSTTDTAMTFSLTDVSTSLSGNYTIQVLSSCPMAGADSSQTLACAKNASFYLPFMAAGVPYYVVVDAAAGRRGDFTLTMTPAVPARNKKCGSEIDIPLAEVTAGVWSGSTTGTNSLAPAVSDYDGICPTSSSASAGIDLVYSFEIPANLGDSRVEVSLLPHSGSAMQPTVYVRSQCTDAKSQVFSGCASNTTSKATAPVAAVAKMPRLPPGTYYVFADSVSTTYQGQFTLTVTVSPAPEPPPNDNCISPNEATDLTPALTLDTASGHYKATVPNIDLTTATNDGAGTFDNNNLVGVSTDPDVVYKITTTTPTKIVARVTRPASSANEMTIRITKSCTSFKPADEYASSWRGAADGKFRSSYTTISTASNYAEVVYNNLPAGAAYIWVDSFLVLDPNSPLTLDVTLMDPQTTPANDTCDSPQVVDLTTFGSGSYPATTLDAANDTGRQSGTSGLEGVIGADVVYKLLIGGPTTLDVQLVSQSPLVPLMWIRTDCKSMVAANVVTGSYKSTTTAGATLAAPGLQLDDGIYYLWIDSYSSGTGTGRLGGPFTLNLTATPRTP